MSNDKKNDWKQEELLQLMTMRQQGYPYTHISAVLGRSNDACRTKVKKIKKMQQEDSKTPHEEYELIETQMIRLWTKDDLRILYEMRRSGISYALIALELNRTEISCSSKYAATNWDTIIVDEKSLLNQDEIYKNRKIDHRERLTRAWDRKNKYHKIGLDLIIDQLKDAIEVLPTVPSPVIIHKNKISRKSEDVVVVISDIHVGAEHSFEETGGLSEFNNDILMKRVENLKLAVRDIYNIHSQLYDLPHLHVVCLGDVVAGDNSSGEWSANYINLPIVEQSISGFALLRNLLNYWLGIFDNVTFYGVRGNHGRIASKGVEKDYCNFDYIIYAFLKMSYENNPRLKFVVPKTWWIMQQIRGWNVLMVHGDDIKGKNFPVKNVVEYQRSMAGMTGKTPNYTLAGHFHRTCEISTEEGVTMINGSFIGGDVYSIKTIHASCKPEQIIFGMNEKRGRTWKYNINLDNDREPDPKDR